MLDIACNCYAMVGTLGWVEVFGIIAKVLSCIIMLSQWSKLPQDWQMPKCITSVQNVMIVGVVMLNLFTLVSNSLFDTRPYQKTPNDNENVAFITNHWYGLWEICSSSIGENGGVCVKWTESRFGTWMASPYWTRPRPIGLDYIIAVLMITILIEFVTLFLLHGWMRRACLVFIPLSNLALTVGAMYLINGIPILTIPVLKYQKGTRSFYGPGWFTLAAAAGNLYYYLKYIYPMSRMLTMNTYTLIVYLTKNSLKNY